MGQGIGKIAVLEHRVAYGFGHDPVVLDGADSLLAHGVPDLEPEPAWDTFTAETGGLHGALPYIVADQMVRRAQALKPGRRTAGSHVPVAWRMKARFSPGMRCTAPMPRTRAARTTGLAVLNSRSSPSVASSMDT